MPMATREPHQACLIRHVTAEKGHRLEETLATCTADGLCEDMLTLPPPQRGACPDRAPPRGAGLQAAPAGGGGTRSGPPAPRVQRGRRRGMRGRARPAGWREKCFQLPLRSCSIQGRSRVVCVFDTSPIRVAPRMSVPARHGNRCYPPATFPQRSGIILRAWRCSQTGPVCEGEQCTDGAQCGRAQSGRPGAVRLCHPGPGWPPLFIGRGSARAWAAPTGT